MSARARFLEPLLWTVKMESFGALEGRGRPCELVVDLELEGAAASSDERVEEKARLLVVDAGLEGFGRVAP